MNSRGEWGFNCIPRGSYNGEQEIGNTVATLATEARPSGRQQGNRGCKPHSEAGNRGNRDQDPDSDTNIPAGNTEQTGNKRQLSDFDNLYSQRRLRRRLERKELELATLATDKATESNQVTGLATLAESQPSGPEKQLNRSPRVRNQSGNKAGNKVDCIGNKKNSRRVWLPNLSPRSEIS